MARYTFGDTALAAERLALVAAVFEAPSRRLLRSAVPEGAAVVDLGCGPGHSTRLIAATCRPRRVLGVDASEAYVDLARRLTDDARVAFAVHDVTSVPLPGCPADAIYARLLLAHLPDPLRLVERWRSQLLPGGVLVLDELEAMEAPPGPLRSYEELVVEVVAQGGGAMYAGPMLASLGGRLVDMTVDAAVAARMYRMNLATWRAAAVSAGLADEAELDDLDDALASLVERPGRAGVRWVLHQSVIAA